jgi:hypothetical protein
MGIYISQTVKYSNDKSHDFFSTWTKVMLKCEGSEESKGEHKNVVIREDQDTDLGHETTTYIHKVGWL